MSVTTGGNPRPASTAPPATATPTATHRTSPGRAPSRPSTRSGGTPHGRRIASGTNPYTITAAPTRMPVAVSTPSCAIPGSELSPSIANTAAEVTADHHTGAAIRRCTAANGCPGRSIASFSPSTPKSSIMPIRIVAKPIDITLSEPNNTPASPSVSRPLPSIAAISRNNGRSRRCSSQNNNPTISVMPLTDCIMSRSMPDPISAANAGWPVNRTRTPAASGAAACQRPTAARTLPSHAPAAR